MTETGLPLKSMLISCIVLAVMSWQQRTVNVIRLYGKIDNILLRRPCMLDMYGIIIFCFVLFFVFSFAWKMDFWTKYGMTLLLFFLLLIT